MAMVNDACSIVRVRYKQRVRYKKLMAANLRTLCSSCDGVQLGLNVMPLCCFV